MRGILGWYSIKKAFRRDIETSGNVLLLNILLAFLPGWKVVVYLIQQSSEGAVVGGFMLAVAYRRGFLDLKESILLIPQGAVCGVVVQSLRCVQPFVIPCTVALQALLTMGCPRQEYWSGLPFPSPGDLPDPGI